MACQHFPDDQTLRLQTGAGENNIIHLPSGLDRVDCKCQEEDKKKTTTIYNTTHRPQDILVVDQHFDNVGGVGRLGQLQLAACLDLALGGGGEEEVGGHDHADVVEPHPVGVGVGHHRP